MVNMVNLNKAELLAATERHVIGEGKLVGLSGAVTGVLVSSRLSQPAHHTPRRRGKSSSRAVSASS